MSEKSTNIVIVAHKFVTHPDDALVEFLNKNKYQNVLHICHSFYDAPDRKSYYTWYKNGTVFEKVETYDYSFLPEPILYLKEIYFTFVWVVFSKIKWQTYIGMDGLCVLVGSLLKKIGLVRKTVYWAIDFVPKDRFSQGWKNTIYHGINTHGYKNSDEMWDLSPRMVKAREESLGVQKNEYKSLKVVPYGMYAERIKKYTYAECEQNTIVFMGHLKESQGVQLLIKILPRLVAQNKKILFKVIGTGPYLKSLKMLATELKMLDHCHFLGKIDDHRVVEDEIARSCVAVAPYIKKLDKWTYYADPGKVKTYLACGVPVILTNLPWNAQEIADKKCGLLVTEDENSIYEAAQKVLVPKTNEVFRKNAIAYAKKFDYEHIFESLKL